MEINQKKIDKEEKDNNKRLNKSEPKNVKKNDNSHYSESSLDKPSKLSIFIDKVGYTSYHYKLLFLSFLVFSLDGFHLTLSSNMIIPFETYYKMDRFWLELSAGIIFLGISVANIFLKNLVNLLDNRLTLFKIGIILISVGHLGMIITSNKILFTIARFIIGFGIGFALSLILSIVSESIPMTKRALAMSTVWVGYSFGQGTCCIVMLLFMPQYQPKMTPIVLSAMFVILFICSAYVFIYIEYSPENLIIKGKYSEAYDSINKIIEPQILSVDKFREFKDDIIERIQFSKLLIL